MPKVNVYLPDKLAEAVRAADVPLSAVCQRALRDALKGIPDSGDRNNPLLGIYGRLYRRARVSVELAIEEAERLREPQVDTNHLLLGILRQGNNAGLQMIEHLGVSRDTLLVRLEQPSSEVDRRPNNNATLNELLSPAAIGAMEAAASASVRYAYKVGVGADVYPIGCEHILVGLLSQDNDPICELLVEHGIELEEVLRAGNWLATDELEGLPVNSAADPETATTAGEPSISDLLNDIVRRLEALEHA